LTGARTPHDPDGSQAERTSLSWTRTSFAVLANGALLMIRNLHGSTHLVGLIPAGLAAVVALCTYVIAMQRQRTLRRRPLPNRIAARRQVYLIGTAMLVLIAVTAVAQSIPGHSG
jgi:uncharacterized membrane protein YidH (DUF202 family)